jgi:hypothetical protein
MRTKYVLLLAAFIATVCATAARADIPIVQADTVFQGFGGGSVNGIVFGQTGETVILMHDAQPVEINIKTKQVLREFEKVPNGKGSQPFRFTDKTKNYLGGTFFSTDYFGEKNISGGILWEIQTGKIIKTLPHIVLLSNGDKYYSYFKRNNQEYFGKFDINTFNMVDSVYLPKDQPGEGYAEWGAVGIIPNTNKVLLGANRYHEFETGKKEYSQAELYLLDFDSKEFTKIPIPYESWQKDARISSISVSETGKYNIVSINIYNVYYYYFYDRNMVLIFKESSENLRQLVNSDYLYYCNINITINDDYLLFSIIDRNKPKEGSIFYDINTKKGTKYLNHFPINTFNNNSQKIASTDENGIIGIFDFIALPVKENPTSNNSFPTVEYKDSNLIINSSSAEKADITITDYNGVLLHTKRNMFLQKGANVIKINVPLGTGVYFCIVKSSAGNNSFKFMVSK